MGYRIRDDIEHPDIAEIETYGYPLRHLPVEQWCEYCGTPIDGDYYEDEEHDYLCAECLLSLHKKDF